MEELSKYQDNLEKLVQKSEQESHSLIKTNEDAIAKQATHSDRLAQSLEEANSEIDQLRQSMAEMSDRILA